MSTIQQQPTVDRRSHTATFVTICWLSLLECRTSRQGAAGYLLEKLVSLLSFDTVIAMMAILLSVGPVSPHA